MKNYKKSWVDALNKLKIHSFANQVIYNIHGIWDWVTVEIFKHLSE